MAKEVKGEGFKLIANNKKASHDYFIEEKYEAGIALYGTEIKSLHMGKCSIKEAFVGIEGGECYIYGMNISPYEKGISSTGIRCAPGNCCCIRARSISLPAKSRSRVIR